MARPQLLDHSDVLPPLNLIYRAQAHTLAQRPQRVVDVPRPGERPDQEREKKEGQHEGLAQREYADHEDEEHDDAPDQADEGDGPGLALGLVRLIKDFQSG